MKYLKRFENEEYEYNVGDIVQVKIADYDLNNDIMLIVNNNAGQIINIDDNNHPFIYKIDYVETFPNSDFSNINVKSSEILRYSTQEEIDEFEIKKNARKYNL